MYKSLIMSYFLFIVPLFDGKVINEIDIYFIGSIKWRKKKEVDMRVETIKWILAKKCPIDMFNNSFKRVLKQRKKLGKKAPW